MMDLLSDRPKTMLHQKLFQSLLHNSQTPFCCRCRNALLTINGCAGGHWRGGAASSGKPSQENSPAMCVRGDRPKPSSIGSHVAETVLELEGTRACCQRTRFQCTGRGVPAPMRSHGPEQPPAPDCLPSWGIQVKDVLWTDGSIVPVVFVRSRIVDDHLHVCCFT